MSGESMNVSGTPTHSNQLPKASQQKSEKWETRNITKIDPTKDDTAMRAEDITEIARLASEDIEVARLVVRPQKTLLDRNRIKHDKKAEYKVPQNVMRQLNPALFDGTAQPSPDSSAPTKTTPPPPHDSKPLSSEVQTKIHDVIQEEPALPPRDIKRELMAQVLSQQAIRGKGYTKTGEISTESVEKGIVGIKKWQIIGVIFRNVIGRITRQLNKPLPHTTAFSDAAKILTGQIKPDEVNTVLTNLTREVQKMPDSNKPAGQRYLILVMQHVRADPRLLEKIPKKTWEDVDNSLSSPEKSDKAHQDILKNAKAWLTKLVNPTQGAGLDDLNAMVKEAESLGDPAAVLKKQAKDFFVKSKWDASDSFSTETMVNKLAELQKELGVPLSWATDNNVHPDVANSDGIGLTEDNVKTLQPNEVAEPTPERASRQEKIKKALDGVKKSQNQSEGPFRIAVPKLPWGKRHQGVSRENAIFVDNAIKLYKTLSDVANDAQLLEKAWPDSLNLQTVTALLETTDVEETKKQWGAHNDDLETLLTNISEVKEKYATLLAGNKILRGEDSKNPEKMIETFIQKFDSLDLDRDGDKATGKADKAVAGEKLIQLLEAMADPKNKKAAEKIKDVSILYKMRGLTPEQQTRLLTALARLPNLQTLSLQGNNLVDITPLKECQSLHHLELSNNSIAELDPSKLPLNLKKLDLSSNEISKISNATWACSQLETLNLQSTIKTSNAFPTASFIGLSSLRSLNLSGNGENMRADILKNIAWSELGQLKELDLTGAHLGDLSDKLLESMGESGLGKTTGPCRLTLNNTHIETIGNLSPLKALTSISLNDNQINDLENAHLGELKSLTTLNLTNNGLKTIPLAVGDLTKLTTLSLDNNKISELPSTIGGMKQLQELQLKNNSLTQLPDEFCQCTELRTVNLSGNPLRGLPENIGALKNLKSLNLEKHNMSSIPTSIWQLNKLKTLGMEVYPGTAGLTSFPDKPEGAPGLEALEELVLTGNTLKTLPKGLEVSKNLKMLNVSSNILEEVPKWVSNFTNLQILNLSGNKITKWDAPCKGLAKVTKLNLSINDLEVLPADIGDMTNLKELFVAGNSLGPSPKSIPTSIHKLELTALNLRGNSLTTFPAPTEGETSSLIPSLRKLDIRDNQLTSLGEDWNQANSMGTLRLDNNKLTALPSSMKAPNLNIVGLSNNRLTTLPKWGFGATQLLHAANNQIADDVSSYAVKFPPTVNLSGNQLKGMLGKRGPGATEEDQGPDLSAVQYLRVGYNPELSVTEIPNTLHELDVKGGTKVTFEAMGDLETWAKTARSENKKLQATAKNDLKRWKLDDESTRAEKKPTGKINLEQNKPKTLRMDPSWGRGETRALAKETAKLYDTKKETLTKATSKASKTAVAWATHDGGSGYQEDRPLYAEREFGRTFTDDEMKKAIRNGTDKFQNMVKEQSSGGCVVFDVLYASNDGEVRRTTANVGDSASMRFTKEFVDAACKDNAQWGGSSTMYEMTELHDPSDPATREKIPGKIGVDMEGKVNVGGLGAAGSLGDAGKAGLIRTPEMKTSKIDHFCASLQACDGIWDFFSEDEVAGVVFRHIQASGKNPTERTANVGKALQAATAELADRALSCARVSEKATDNTTVICQYTGEEALQKMKQKGRVVITGIVDGHGGEKVAQMAQEQLTQMVMDELSKIA